MSNFTLEEGQIITDQLSGDRFTQKDGVLYRSQNNTTWDKISESGSWSIAKDTHGNVHSAWSDANYTTSYLERGR